MTMSSRYLRLFVRGCLISVLCTGNVYSHDGTDHVLQDSIDAAAAADAPEFVVTAEMVADVAPDQRALMGEWGPVINWPHIPVSAANLPDGRILTWASNLPDEFPEGPEYTYAATWNPQTGEFIQVHHDGHDMFCAHQVMLENGKVFVNGGRAHVRTTSVFDHETNSWTIIDPMKNGRWYPTSVALADGRVLTAIGSSGGRYPEIWEENYGWKMLTGIDLQNPILGYSGFYEQNWWPYLSVMPSGEVLHYGPTPMMHRVNPNGNNGAGSITSVGSLSADWYPKHGASVVYDESLILVAGGATGGNVQESTNSAIVIDMSTDVPTVRPTTAMNFARKFQNAVMLPNGEVLMVGGNTSGAKFDDTGTVLTTEIWNPESEQWSIAADISVPRNYHSIALLMLDGRVLSGGGGLCGNCAANHQDAQIYTPAYLYNLDGTLATRPEIISAPSTIVPGQSFTVNASENVTAFSLIKMSSTTHAVNTDQRFLNLEFAQNADGTYQVQAHANPHVLTTGYYMLFALVNGVPSVAKAIQVENVSIILTNPGSQSVAPGELVTLPITAYHPLGQSITYNAFNLPPGLTIDADTGVISGAIEESVLGVFHTQVTADDGVIQSVMSFAWEIQGENSATGRLLYQRWEGVSGVEVDKLLNSIAYTGPADNVQYLDSFQLLNNQTDSYGARFSGYLYPPVSGYYQFWIAANERANLYLSIDENEENKSLIAQVNQITSINEWDASAQQKSILVYLNAGNRYYIEAIHKEAFGSDHLSVAWKIPGLPRQIISGAYLSEPETGAILHERWNNIGGVLVSDLLSADNFPDSPSESGFLGSMDIEVDAFSTYGTRLQGYLVPPVSGYYTFWISSDDNGELYLSNDFDINNKELIATVPGWSNHNEWNKYPQQTSTSIFLQQDQRYYIEALQKENDGGDNLSVAWQIPGYDREIIDAKYVEMYSYNADPKIDMAGVQSFQQDELVSILIQVTGEGPFNFGVSDLPPGLFLDADTGVISGTISSAGNFQSQLTVTDANGNSSVKALLWNITAGEPNGVRYVMLVAESEVNGNPWSSMAEIDLYDELGETIDRSQWLVSTDSEELGSESGAAVNAIDNNTSTIWHSEWSQVAPVHPHAFIVDMGTFHYVKSLAYTPRVDIENGRIANYSVFVSADGTNWGDPVATGSFSNNALTQQIELDTVLPISIHDLAVSSSLASQAAHFSISVEDAESPQFTWDFGDGSEQLITTENNASHVYQSPGRYIVTVTASENGFVDTESAVQLVHNPIVDSSPAVSQSVIYQVRTEGDRVWNVNPDNNSVTVLDAGGLEKLAEINVGTNPRSLALIDEEVWVANKADATITIISGNSLSVTDTISLDKASQPYGLVSSDSGKVFVVLSALGELVQIDAATLQIESKAFVADNIRHVALSADQSSILVSQFITPPLPGEHTESITTEQSGMFYGGRVFKLSTSNLSVTDAIVLRHSNKTDAENAGRGVPNYLGSIAVSPDGTAAWVPSKQDNVKRGGLRDGRSLTFDSTVRSIVSKIQLLGTPSEDYPARIDNDDAGIASAAVFGPLGIHLYVALEGSREIAIVNAHDNSEVRRVQVGRAPQGVAVSPDGQKVFVHNFMDRSISVLDVSGLLKTNGEVALTSTVNTVDAELLSQTVLKGKQFFYDSFDPRISALRYISCASCHNEGDHDGRVWDFTGFGEGLRNTIDLRGKAGMHHGPLHWTGNFDEVQDFEGQLRTLDSGFGLMSNAEFNQGTVHLPLGDAKQGISADLDALAEYVSSLQHSNPSPFREESGALTEQAELGKSIFSESGCSGCHSGDVFTNSALNQFENIGTLTSASGQRLGSNLSGLDTPSLKGIWSGAPYLHNGSAGSLMDAVNAHDNVVLSSENLSNLVAYLKQIDDMEISAPNPAGNQAPEFSLPSQLESDLGIELSLNVAASDNDGGSLTYTAVGLPPGLKINSSTGIVTGSPLTLGSYLVVLRAFDNQGAMDKAQITWNIIESLQCDVSTNIALNGAASQSSQYSEEVYNPRPWWRWWDFGWNFYINTEMHFAQDAIDNNASTFSNTAVEQSPASWQVQFASDMLINEVVLENRTDCCAERLRDVQVAVFNAAGETVYRSELLNPENILAGPSAITVSLPQAMLGNRVRVDRLPDDDLSGGAESSMLALSEVSVMGCQAP